MPPRIRNKEIVFKIFLVSTYYWSFKILCFYLFELLEVMMNSFLYFDFSVEEIVKLLDLIPQQLDMKNYNETCVKAIIRLNSALKQHGSQLEHLHRNLLDKAQVFYTEGWFKR